MTTTGKKLKVIFMLIILSLSNFVPLSAIADTTDDPTVLETISAEVISDQSGKKALNIKLNANNTSAEKIEKEIGLVENYLSDVERKEGDGYAYQVNSGKITLEISSNTKQTIDLSFPIDPALYHSQANKLIVDNKEYDIIDETENKKDTDVSVPKPDEIEEESSKENENSVSPFTLPTLSLPAVSVPSNQTIPTEYTTDDQGTYPKASWQPTGNTNVLDHQGNKNGTNQWDGINSWNGDPNDRTHSYIEYGGTGNQQGRGLYMLQIGHYSFIMMDATAVANKNGAILASQIGCIPRRITVFFSHDQKLIQLDHFILEFPCRDLRITFCKKKDSLCLVQYFTDLI